jgi:hypothetical protein
MVHYRAWYVRKLGEVRPEWYVFPFGIGPKPVDPTRPATNLKKSWQRLKKKLNLKYRLHDTRHTVATAMAVAGVPEAKRRYLMGHVDENVIKRYTHLQADDCRADLPLDCGKLHLESHQFPHQSDRRSSSSRFSDRPHLSDYRNFRFGRGGAI